MRILFRLACLLLLGLLGACADTRYYYQSVAGHLEMMRLARPLEQWLADERASATLKQRLTLAATMRSFAVTKLKLPDNASYRRYADLQRGAAVWNVVAASEFSLELKTWCFMVVGCVSYRGYFDENQARAQALALQQDGFEVSVYGVPAYSTLGWLDWLGGDPLLSTFIAYPEGELARMLFHELAHQVVYIKDDSLFNESFASAVERLGTEQWLADHGSASAKSEYAQLDARRREFRALSLATRRQLAQIYQAGGASKSERAGMLAMKNSAMQDFREAYAKLKGGWGGYKGFDAWVAGANNAAFGAQAVYDAWVPAFALLFVREGRDWQRFYDAVRRLAQLPAAERAQALKQLAMESNGV